MAWLFNLCWAHSEISEGSRSHQSHFKPPTLLLWGPFLHLIGRSSHRQLRLLLVPPFNQLGLESQNKKALVPYSLLPTFKCFPFKSSASTTSDCRLSSHKAAPNWRAHTVSRIKAGATANGPATELSGSSGPIAGVAQQRKSRKNGMGALRHLKPELWYTWEFHSP